MGCGTSAHAHTASPPTSPQGAGDLILETKVRSEFNLATEKGQAGLVADLASASPTPDLTATVISGGSQKGSKPAPAAAPAAPAPAASAAPAAPAPAAPAAAAGNGGGAAVAQGASPRGQAPAHGAAPKKAAPAASSDRGGVFLVEEKIRSLLDQSITRQLMSTITDQGGKVCAEYVWIGGSGQDLRSKSRTVNFKPTKPEDLPHWNYDGSSTGQAPGHDSEVYLVPRAIFKDPFRGGDNILVMCDTYEPPRVNPDGSVTPMKPIPTNTRAACAEVMEKAKDQEPWFGIEQEYTLLNAMTKWPLGWPRGGYPAPQGPYYCAAGAGVSIGRDVPEVHYRLCMYAGVAISGLNGEVLPSQWEYQVGPCVGIDMGDHLWMSRYIMYRVAEMYNVDVSFDPKPVPGDWNGSGGHTNFSNKATRTPGTGWDAIQQQCEKLGKRHAVHIAAYGEGNERRLTGKHETSSMADFSWGVANRGCSIRVGRMVPVEKCGYYEDRRPASNLDPYVVCRLLAETTLLM